jgi:aminopeptidase-like protein
MKDFFYEFMKEHYLLNRTAVSEDTDRLVRSIQKLLECNVIEILSGTECLTWIVPKSWNVRDAYLAKVDGTRLVDFRDNPLHLWSHSVGFQGVVSRENLEEHLYYDPEHPGAIPYHYRNAFRFDAEDWGFSLPYDEYKAMTEDSYRVHIDAELGRDGTMKILDYLLPGDNRETILFAAHTCHPGQVTDGLSNIAVLIRFFMYLGSLGRRRYSYRLVLGPEYFGAAGFLAMVSQEEIGRIKAGIYLDLLGNNYPLGYQTSYQADSLLDRILERIFKHHVPDHRAASFRGLVGNDEIFYNGPGFNIPMPGIACPTHPEYHSDRDNLEIVNLNQLEQSHGILEKIVHVLESDYVPVPRFKGPIYLSRYDLYIDPKVDRRGYDKIQEIQFLMNGEMSCFDIAYALGVDYLFVKTFCDQLAENDLVIAETRNSFT